MLGIFEGYGRKRVNDEVVHSVFMGFMSSWPVLLFSMLAVPLMVLGEAKSNRERFLFTSLLFVLVLASLKYSPIFLSFFFLPPVLLLGQAIRKRMYLSVILFPPLTVGISFALSYLIIW